MTYKGAEDVLGEPRVLRLPYLTESNRDASYVVCGAQDGVKENKPMTKDVLNVLGSIWPHTIKGSRAYKELPTETVSSNL